MKMTHLDYLPIPAGTMYMSIIAHGEQDGKFFDVEWELDGSDIVPFLKSIGDQIREDNTKFDDEEKENEACYALTEKGKQLLQEIEENLYKPYNP